MKKHLLSLAVGILLSGTLPQNATAQVANPAENPERYFPWAGWMCELTYWDRQARDTYIVPPHLDHELDPERKYGYFLGLVARGWYWVRFTEYPFAHTLRDDTVYRHTDIKPELNELRVALAQLEERFSSFVIATAMRAGNQPCDVDYRGGRSMRGWAPQVPAELPYFFLRFDNYISKDTVLKHLWHLPKTAKPGEYGDFASHENITVIESLLLNKSIFYGPDVILYFPYWKATGYIFQGDRTLSTPDDAASSTPVLLCYPNPAFTRMEIRLFTPQHGIEAVEIVDLQGTVIQRYTVEGATTLYADVSTLSTGTYFVRYGSFTQKILIAR